MDTMLFFCDIRGTITDNNNELNHQFLKNKLDEIKQLYNCEQLIFSLISSDDFETIEDYAHDLKKNHIPLGKQFYEEGYIEYSNVMRIKKTVKDKSKFGKMKKYMEELKETHHLKLVCYADDTADEIYSSIIQIIAGNDSTVHLIKPSSRKDDRSDNYFETTKKGINGLLLGLDYMIEQKKLTKQR